MESDEKSRGSSTTFKVGAVCFAFLIIGYQAAIFVHRASVLRVEAMRDRPDTVYVVETIYGGAGATDVPEGGGTVRTERRPYEHHPHVQAVLDHRRRVESFRFDPNTAGPEELMRLGFSEKQASAIVNYREKGGRFRRKTDFAKSFVVPDSVYRRLEPYIDIPLVDINKADSAAFDALPGIGPYFASRMVSYRSELGGYSYPEQLMDIYRFDREKYDGLSDLITCSRPSPFRIWSLSADSLRLHPYIRSWHIAKAIVLYRENTAPELRNVADFGPAGIMPDSMALKLSKCVLE